MLAWPLLASVFALAPRNAFAPEPTVPQPLGYVSDYVGVIDPGIRQRIEALVRELRDKTGAEIAVVIVRSTKPLTAFDYAMKIAESWRPGDRRKDNGVVFLVAVDDRELFILTGYGVEGILPDGRVGEIRDRWIVPAFRRGDYSAGVWLAVQEMARLIARDAGVELTGLSAARAPRPAPGEPPLWDVVVLVILVAFLLVFFLAAAPRRRFYSRRRAIYWGGGGFGGGFRGGGGFGGGGFGGFGGGGFGGGGAGGRW